MTTDNFWFLVYFDSRQYLVQRNKDPSPPKKRSLEYDIILHLMMSLQFLWNAPSLSLLPYPLHSVRVLSVNIILLKNYLYLIETCAPHKKNPNKLKTKKLLTTNNTKNAKRTYNELNSLIYQHKITLDRVTYH